VRPETLIRWHRAGWNLGTQILGRRLILKLEPQQRPSQQRR
jgi:hypothetical protein